MEWQPIETAPKDKEILLFFPVVRPTRQAGYGAPQMIRVDKLHNWDYGNRIPTHWMPLPPPPAAEG